MITLPTLLKTPTRFSEERRPPVGSTVIFSHAFQLLLTDFVPEAKDFNRDEIYNGAEAKVIENKKNIVEVLFNGSEQTDLVSPEFLTTGELTAAGEKLFQHKGMSAELRKCLLELQKA